MIFVTVGNTAFDSMIEAVDGLEGEIIIQKADGKYIPKNHEYFEYGDLEPYFKRSAVVVTHGGAGNIFRLLSKGKKVVAVANMDRTDKHQPDLLSKLESEKYLVWCKDLKKIREDITKATKSKFAKYKCPECTIAMEIKKYV